MHTVALALFAATTAFGTSAQPSTLSLDGAGMEPKASAALHQIPASTPASALSTSISRMQVMDNAKLIDQPAIRTHAASSVMKKASATAADANFTGTWIMSYETLLENGQSGGGAVNIKATDVTNTYVIQNFWSTGLEVAATIDPATGVITIPNQVFATTADGDKVDVTAIHQGSGTPNRSVPITGKINSDGTITIDTWWAVYLADKNEISGGMFGAYYNTVMRRPNGQFSFTQNGETSTVPVYANQVADNVLEVTNILDGGLTIEMTLNRNLTATIGLQPILENSDANYNICNAVIEDDGKNISFKNPITTAVATDRKVMTWTNWTGYGLTPAGKATWLGMFTTGTLTLDNDVNYPTLETSSLKGAGTKENPWLISTKDDLIYLSDMVNGQTGSASGTLICTGEYFRMTNDIDMSSYRFTSIAKDYYHIFNGTFDGAGYTIHGLNTVAPANTYGGLFGRTGEQSVITNITFRNANISAQAFAGCVAAWSAGVISDINVMNSTVTNASNGTGVVANIVNEITNCHADSCNITGLRGYVGGLVGQLNKTMTGCSATNMRIVGASADNNPSPVGGLVALANFQSVMTDSYYSGTIDASHNYTVCYTGGLVGTSAAATMERCFFVGTVRGYSADSYTGGLIGYAMSANILNCYAVGRVDNPSSRRTGTLTGYLGYGTYNNEIVPGTILNSYSAMAMLAETYLYNPETERRELFGLMDTQAQYTIENCYYNKQLVNFGSTQYGVMTSDLVAAAGPAGFPADTWAFTAGQYPRLKGIDQNQAALYSASALVMDANSNMNKLSQNAAFNAMGNTQFGYLKNGQIVKQGTYSSIEGDSIILNKEYAIGTDTLFVVNGRAQYHYFLKVAPVPFAGEGTQESPYLISTSDDLIKLSQMTTISGQTFPGTYFLMTNDIDLEYSTDFLGIMCNDGSTANFAGIFDGGGYAVHKMKLGEPKWTKEPTATSLGTLDTKSMKSYQGFIGRLAAEGVLRNFTLAEDCQIKLGGYSGAVVGYNFGRIENCRNLADVTTYHGIYIGGITGYNNNTETAVVINCYNGGNIQSGRYGVGGITGVNYNLIKECVNTGNISTTDLCTNFTGASKHYLAGGITGSMNGRLENCINYGTVTSSSRVGGLSGSLSKVTGTSYAYKNDVVNCINVGMVYSENLASCGAIGGDGGTDGTVSGTYWDAQLLPLAAAGNAGAAGMEGVDTSVLTSGNALEGYDADIWDFTAGQYPALKSRVNDEGVKQARAITVNMANGIDTYNLTAKEATLSEAEGLTWKLANGTQFSINGTKLNGPASVNKLVTDTLYASYGKIVKPILVKAMPPMPLAGAGTETDPYLIANAADWNSLAGFMAMTNNSLEGNFVALTADIDFSDTDFVSLAGDGATFFNGTLDGKGHTVSGIKLTATATNAGAIGTVGTTGVVRNLTLAGDITSTLGSVGGFTGNLYGQLENCVNAINVNGGTKATAGGFAATFFGNATLTDCVNKGNVTAQSNVGGFAGTFNNAAKVTMTRCSNSGTITGNTTKAYAGGLVGTAYPATFTDCSNSGTVTVKTPTSQTFAAGLIGYASGSAGADPYIFTGCSNSGDITAKSGVAGLVAEVHATAGYAVLLMTDCTNSGNITAKGSQTSTANAGIAAMITPGSKFVNCSNTGKINVTTNTNTGGITGYTRTAGTAANPISITGCANTGEIVATGANVGGIIGNAGAYIYLDSCSNTAAVTANGTAYAVGGIAGALTNVNTAITNSWNTGDITTATNRAGGIVGMNAQKSQITDCWNGGNITSLSETQGVAAKSGYGIGGVAGQSASVITHCYNFGTVTGVSRTGGVIGAPVKDNTQLISCYNAGRIMAPADTCGNITGINMANGALWTTKNVMTGCYYVTDFGVYDNNAGFGNAVSMAQLSKTDMGEEWTVPAEYTLPILTKYAADEAALLYSAAVILSDGDTYDSVTRGFSLGTPGLVKWTSSVSELTIDGNQASFNAPYTGEILLTATAGDLTRTFAIKAVATTTGIDSITADEDAEAEYYNLQGIRVINPEAGQIYIVRRGKTATKEFYGK